MGITPIKRLVVPDILPQWQFQDDSGNANVPEVSETRQSDKSHRPLTHIPCKPSRHSLSPIEHTLFQRVGKQYCVPRQ